MATPKELLDQRREQVQLINSRYSVVFKNEKGGEGSVRYQFIGATVSGAEKAAAEEIAARYNEIAVSGRKAFRFKVIDSYKGAMITVGYEDDKGDTRTLRFDGSGKVIASTKAKPSFAAVAKAVETARSKEPIGLGMPETSEMDLVKRIALDIQNLRPREDKTENLNFSVQRGKDLTGKKVEDYIAADAGKDNALAQQMAVELNAKARAVGSSVGFKVMPKPPSKGKGFDIVLAYEDQGKQFGLKFDAEGKLIKDGIPQTTLAGIEEEIKIGEELIGDSSQRSLCLMRAVKEFQKIKMENVSGLDPAKRISPTQGGRGSGVNRPPIPPAGNNG